MEKIRQTCDIDCCPATNTTHAHMDKETRNWRPSSKIKISQDASAIASIIIASFDGLTAEQNPVHGETDMETMSRLRAEREIILLNTLLDYNVTMELVASTVD